MNRVMCAFSIYDRKAQVYLPPFYFSYKGEATRAFEDICKNRESIISKHPEDYDLYMIGTFNSDSGALESLGAPEFIMKATDFNLENK